MTGRCSTTLPAGCWVGSVSLGRDPGTGKRLRRKVSAPTKTECKDKLDELRREFRKAGTVGRRDITVRTIVDDGIANLPAEVRSDRSVEVYRNAGRRICDGARGFPGIGSMSAAKLTPAHVDRLLADHAKAGYSASTIRQTRAVLARCLRRAQRAGLVGRNAAELADLPRGAKVRKSKAMTGDQVAALLALRLTPWRRAYIVTSIMLGLRPGEMLGLRWADIDSRAGHLRVRQSLKRTGGLLILAELKTPSSRRTLAMPAMVAAVLDRLRRAQAAERLRAGSAWHDHGLVFPGATGAPRWPQEVNSGLKALCERAGIGRDWQPRETRHTFVSALSDAGVNIERIADAAGHVNSNVTKTVYRHLLADVVSETATVMDSIYPAGGAREGS